MCASIDRVSSGAVKIAAGASSRLSQSRVAVPKAHDSMPSQAVLTPPADRTQALQARQPTPPSNRSSKAGPPTNRRPACLEEAATAFPRAGLHSTKGRTDRMSGRPSAHSRGGGGLVSYAGVLLSYAQRAAHAKYCPHQAKATHRARPSGDSGPSKS
jgi:hypothetical protein